MIVNRNDYQLVGEGGYGVGYQLLNTSAFNPEEINIAKQLLTSRKENYGAGVVAIDCGANLGVHTIEWARLMSDWGRVIAVEAQERIFYALAGNIAMNNCFNARAIWAAIGDKTGSIGVPIPNYFMPSNFGGVEIKKRATPEFIGQEINYAETQDTRLMTIDEMSLERLDFVKMDIEGMEMDALSGAVDSIEKFMPQLMIEKIKSNVAELIDFLKARDYQIFNMGINILAVHSSDPVLKQIKIN
jgi:FkbM family methyltransferase